MRTTEHLSASLVDFLLSSIDGFRFERLIQDLLAIRDGEAFVGLGGVKDGGADGFFRDLLQSTNRPTAFVQMSIQEDVAGKVRKTVARLREFGRTVESLAYWTPQRPHVDVLEEELSSELGITLRIRDRLAVQRLIDHDEKTRAHFLGVFKPELYELSSAGQRVSEHKLDVVSDPSVYVFLQFERLERQSKGGLLAPIVDALIYWALRSTDPDTGKLLERQEIKASITELLPGASNNLVPLVDERLRILATKDGGGEQRVRFYKDSDSYCLPFLIRVQIAEASTLELNLQVSVRESLKQRAIQADATNPELVAAVAEKAIYKHFHEQGLILAAFLEKRLEGLTISDQIVETELQAAAGGRQIDQKSYVAALRVLQGIFYTPNDGESEFLRRLSRTSMLLFSLKHSPRLIEYFNQMTGQFRLLIGTDILVKAMTETFLPTQHRHVTNLLAVAKNCGAKLLLTAPVAKELFTHMYASHCEFVNHYAAQEPYITAPIAAQSDRILIRTYFYARLLLQRVKGWKSFVGMFVDYEELAAQSPKGEAQLQAYFEKTFGLEFLELGEHSALVKKEELDALTKNLMSRNFAKNEALAYNDALMVLSVYAARRGGKEASLYDGFGVRTWWLTKEINVLEHTAAIVRKNDGIPYIMRPEFLLNFLTLSPKAAQAGDPAVRELLPSHVGLQIGLHLPSHHMHRILGQFDDWKELPTSRVEVRVTEAANQLKYDRLKRYNNNLDLQGDAEADVLIAALRDEGIAKG